MKELLEKYKQYLQARGQSLAYYNFMNVFLKYCEENKIDYKNLSQEIITQFFTVNEYAIESRNNFIKAGRNFYRFLEIVDEANEWKKIALLKAERKIPNYLTEKDLGKVISYINTYHDNIITSIKTEALFDFLFYSGVRKAELLKLKRTDFNLEECFAKVYGKGKKERIVYYPKKVAEQINSYFKAEVEESNAFNISLYNINYLIQNLKKYFPDKKITCHLFRHSGARHMIDKGLPLGTVSRILGHSSIATTIIYTDPNEETIRRQYQEKIK